MVRVFFQIEQAHWYYIDFLCQEQLLPTYGLKEFTKINILLKFIYQEWTFLFRKLFKLAKLFYKYVKYKANDTPKMFDILIQHFDHLVVILLLSLSEDDYCKVLKMLCQYLAELMHKTDLTSTLRATFLDFLVT